MRLVRCLFAALWQEADGWRGIRAILLFSRLRRLGSGIWSFTCLSIYTLQSRHPAAGFREV
ncbi:MAG: hypothetical protein ACOYEP_06795 [Limnochordia bacterium]|jgi:hypothetical protein